MYCFILCEAIFADNNQRNNYRFKIKNEGLNLEELELELIDYGLEEIGEDSEGNIVLSVKYRNDDDPSKSLVTINGYFFTDAGVLVAYTSNDGQTVWHCLTNNDPEYKIKAKKEIAGIKTIFPED